MKTKLLIVVLAVVAAGAGYAVFRESGSVAPQITPAPTSTPPPSSGAKVFSTQEECERETGKECRFQMCDYIPPGRTFEEACGKDFHEGWAPVD